MTPNPASDADKPSLVLGVPLMDRDHAALERLFAAAESAPDDALTGMAETLAREFESHFTREEALMAEAGLPILHCHRGQHAQLLSEVAALVGGNAAAQPAMLRRQIRFLAQLVEAHVASVDRVSSEFLNGHMPAAAFAGFRRGGSL